VENAAIGTLPRSTSVPVSPVPAQATLTAYAAQATAVDVSDGLIGSSDNTNGPRPDGEPGPCADLDMAPPGGPASAGLPFPFTVTARDPYGNTDAGYAGAVVFASSDPGATLPPAPLSALPTMAPGPSPPPSARRAADRHRHDDADPSLAGTATWSVSAAAIDHYAVTSDSYIQTAGASFAVTVTARDALTIQWSATTPHQ